MPQIRGRIVLKESGVGIPGLLVVVSSDDATARDDVSFPDSGSGRRIGSVVTTDGGDFALSYDTASERAGAAPGRTLELTVFGPDDPDAVGGPAILFQEPTPRQRAGEAEEYAIRLSAARLTAAGIPLPSTAEDELEDAGAIVGRILASDDRTATI